MRIVVDTTNRNRTYIYSITFVAEKKKQDRREESLTLFHCLLRVEAFKEYKKPVQAFTNIMNSL